MGVCVGAGRVGVGGRARFENLGRRQTRDALSLSLSLSRSLCSRQGRKQIDLLGMDGARGAVGVRVPSGVAGKS